MIAPTLTPRTPGECIMTDRRDAAKLVRLFRAGELTAIHVPDETEEGVRDAGIPLPLYLLGLARRSLALYWAAMTRSAKARASNSDRARRSRRITGAAALRSL